MVFHLKIFVMRATSHPHPPNQHIRLGLHPTLLELVDIASHNELKTRSFFIREALIEALINRGAIADLENNSEFQNTLMSLCGSRL